MYLRFAEKTKAAITREVTRISADYLSMSLWIVVKHTNSVYS